MIKIREEQKQDIEAIRQVNDLAFGQKEEGLVVDQIRSNCREIVSLVACVEEQIVGHILFSPAQIQHKGSTIIGMGLAPLAVLPEFQNMGLGTKLVEDGLGRIKQLNYPFAIVLGHDEYYPRFGFEIASTHHLMCQWSGVPDEAFMVLILNQKVMDGVSGVARYRDEFDLAM